MSMAWPMTKTYVDCIITDTFWFGFWFATTTTTTQRLPDQQKKHKVENLKSHHDGGVTGDNEVYHCQFDLTLWKPKQLTLRIVDFNLLCGRSNDDLNSECIWFA